MVTWRIHDGPLPSRGQSWGGSAEVPRKEPGPLGAQVRRRVPTELPRRSVRFPSCSRCATAGIRAVATAELSKGSFPSEQLETRALKELLLLTASRAGAK